MLCFTTCLFVLSCMTLYEVSVASLPWMAGMLTPVCSANTCPDSKSFRKYRSQQWEVEEHVIAVASDSQSDWFNGEYHTIGQAELPDCCSKGDSQDECTVKVGRATNKALIDAVGEMKVSEERGRARVLRTASFASDRLKLRCLRAIRAAQAIHAERPAQKALLKLSAEDTLFAGSPLRSSQCGYGRLGTNDQEQTTRPQFLFSSLPIPLSHSLTLACTGTL